MKKKMFSLLVIFLSAVVATQACNIDFKMNGNKKNCQAGDVIEVTVTLTLIHSVCSLPPSETKFKIDGVKVLKASDWKQTGPTKFQRTVQMKVLPSKKDKITLMAVRTCDKEGGTGTFTLPKI